MLTDKEREFQEKYNVKAVCFKITCTRYNMPGNLTDGFLRLNAICDDQDQTKQSYIDRIDVRKADFDNGDVVELVYKRSRSRGNGCRLIDAYIVKFLNHNGTKFPYWEIPCPTSVIEVPFSEYGTGGLSGSANVSLMACPWGGNNST